MSDKLKTNHVQQLMQQVLAKQQLALQPKLHDPHTPDSYFMSPSTLEELKNHPDLKDAMRVLGNGINFYETQAVPEGQAYMYTGKLMENPRMSVKLENISTETAPLYPPISESSDYITFMDIDGKEYVVRTDKIDMLEYDSDYEEATVYINGYDDPTVDEDTFRKLKQVLTK